MYYSYKAISTSYYRITPGIKFYKICNLSM